MVFDDVPHDAASFFRKVAYCVRIFKGATSNALLLMTTLLHTCYGHNLINKKSYRLLEKRSLSRLNQKKASATLRAGDHIRYRAISHLHWRLTRTCLVWVCQEYHSWRIARNVTHRQMPTRENFIQGAKLALGIQSQWQSFQKSQRLFDKRR